MTRRKVILVALAALGAAGWFTLGRPLMRGARLAGPVGPPADPVTEEHITWLRRIRFSYAPLIEGGAPLVDPVAPYGGHGMPGFALHVEVSALFVWLAANWPLTPGNYPLEGLSASDMEARLRLEMGGGLRRWPQDAIEQVVTNFPMPETDGQFTFSEPHARLIPGLVWEWPDQALRSVLTRAARLGHLAPVVDFERPFGNAAILLFNIAHLLDLPQPETVEGAAALYRHFDALWPALQTFVQNVPIEPGSLMA